MKKILNLYKMLNKNNTSDKGDSSKLFMFIVGGVMISFILGYVGYKFSDSIEMMGGVPIILSVSGLVAGIGIFAFGFFSLINSMYMSSDIELLITLPLSSTQIVLLRLLSFLGLAFGIGFVAIIPISIGFAVATSAGITSWVSIILEYIFVPVFATFITASVVILLMSVVRIFRNVDVLRYIGIGVLFILLCLYFFFANSNNSHVEVNSLITILAGFGTTLQYVDPVSGFMSAFVTSGSIIDLLISIALLVASVLLFLIVAKFLYLEGALNMQSTSVSGKILNDEELSKACTNNGTYKSLVKKEFNMLRRNPAYSLNNFVIGFLWPILAVVLMYGTISSVTNMFTPSEGAQDPTTLSIRFVIMSTCLIMFIMILIPMTYQSIAYSSLSREGKSFPIMKQIPVDYKIQIKAKLTVAERIQHIQTTGYVLLGAVIIYLIMGVPVYFALCPTLLAFTFSEMAICMDMLNGYKNASVNWDNEKSIASKNSGAMFAFYILSAFGVPIVCALGFFFAFDGNPYLGLIPMLVLSVIFGIIMIPLRKRVFVKGDRRIRTLRF
ncbi:MAG TPA: hypothetical protein DCR12_02425 [Lachnospiraceae bacterium]|nr:hypothetical protein [Lachnospiraceae bacterium]